MKPPVEAPTSSASAPCDVEPERVERVGELDAAAGDVARGGRDLDLDVWCDQLPGLVGPPPARQQQHLAGEHRRGRPCARFEHPALRQQAVEANALHAPGGLDDLGAVGYGGFDPLGDPLGGEPDLLVQQRRRAVGDVAVGQPDAEDAEAALTDPASLSVSHTAEPKPPASTPSSTVTSSSCSAASWAARPASIGLAKRASATVAVIPCSARMSAASSALSTPVP